MTPMARTRMIKKALSDAGYVTNAVRSTQEWTGEQGVSWVFGLPLDDMAAYLAGYLGSDATVGLRPQGGDFIVITWSADDGPEDRPAYTPERGEYAWV